MSIHSHKTRSSWLLSLTWVCLTAGAVTPLHAQSVPGLGAWAYGTDVQTFVGGLMGTAASLSGSHTFITGSAGTLDWTSANLVTSTDISTLGFNAANGVLIGVSGTLAIANPDATYLGADRSGTGGLSNSLNGAWTIGGLSSGPAPQTLLSYQTIQDSQYSFGGPTLLNVKDPTTQSASTLNHATWTPLSISSADTAKLNTLVTNTFGTNPAAGQTLSTTVTTNFGVVLTKKSNETVQTRITSSTDLNHAQGALAPGLTAVSPDMALMLNYYTVAHSNASFASAAANDLNDKVVDLSPGNSSVAVDVTAMGTGTGTTGLHLSSIQCLTGLCTGVNVTASFADLVGGTTGRFKVALDPNAPAGASYGFRLNFADDATVGASNSQASNFLTLTVNTAAVADTTPPSAVPEPHNAAMLLAGLGAIGWMSRRRRGKYDQFAKL